MYFKGEMPNAAGCTGPSDVRACRAEGALRPAILVCGDLFNLGDLALAAQNIAIARRQGRIVQVRTWGPLPHAIERQLRDWGAEWFDGRDLAALLARARHSDLIFGGGELVRRNMSVRSLASLSLAAAIVRHGGGSIVARGLGVGQVDPVRGWLWRGIFSGARLLCVRDRRSAANLHRIMPDARVVQSADMAFLGDGLVGRAATASGQTAILVAACIDASEQRAVGSSRIAQAVAAAQRLLPGAPVRMVSHDPRPGMDGDAAARIVADSGMAALPFDAGHDLATVLGLYRDAALVITNRLHAGIFAVLFERPVLVLDDGNPKLRVLTDTLGVPSLPADGAAGPPIALPVAAALGFDRAQRRAARQREGLRAARNLAPVRVGIFNVKYSPNLGDGIIAECLEGELRRADARLCPVSIDLAGRSRFTARNGRHRRSVLRLLEILPAAQRRQVMPLALQLLVRTRLAPRFSRAVDRCDVAVIGGGALFADADQNFPTKIGAALSLCARRGVPVAVAAVGVSGEWSAAGLARMTDGLARADLLSVSVRDDTSAATWQRVFASQGIEPARTMPDPGLLCADQYGPAPARDTDAGCPVVGLCVTAPVVLRLHTDDEHDEAVLEAWFRAVAEGLIDSGCDVVLFTNGSPEDCSFRDRIADRLGPRTGLRVEPDFERPDQLVGCIAGLDAVLAHRLHACIAAYSYRIPAIGLAWDRKLRSFFEQTGRAGYVIDPREESPMATVRLARRALAEPVDPAVHSRLVRNARAGIADLARKLTIAGGAA